ncbi:MAG TPA: hypothetical protein DEB43_06520 [Desulfovibrio sp.]|nr:hypothetical protein [Desulfovibrio sp.]
MLLLSTLGNWFPRVWENDKLENDKSEKVTYFKTKYTENRVIMQNFNEHYSISNPQYAFARYCEYKGNPLQSAQEYEPSIVCVYKMEEMAKDINGFDLAITYSVCFKIVEREIADMINAIQTRSLMYSVDFQSATACNKKAVQILDEFLSKKFKRI